MNIKVLDRALRIGAASTSASGGAIKGQPARVQLFGGLLPGWRFENPLPISVERDSNDGRFVVSDDIFNVYGVGGSWDAAVGDYKVALVEFFEITAEAQDDQSRRLLDHLKAYLRRS